MGAGETKVFGLVKALSSILAFLLDDDGLARRGEFGLYLVQLGLDDRLHAGSRAQDFQIVVDLQLELLELLGNLVAAERGQALQAQIEDGPRLFHRQADGAVGGDWG